MHQPHLAPRTSRTSRTSRARTSLNLWGLKLSVAPPTPLRRKAGARAPLRSDAHPCAPALQIIAPIKWLLQQTVATLGRPAALDLPTGALDREWEPTLRG